MRYTDEAFLPLNGSTDANMNLESTFPERYVDLPIVKQPDSDIGEEIEGIESLDTSGVHSTEGATMNGAEKAGGAVEDAACGTALDRLGAALQDRLDLSTYRSIMAWPTWYVAIQVVVVTRSYDKGLDVGLRLLEYTAAHKHVLGAQEFDGNMKQLYYFVLDMLDRSDQWEAYLGAWEQIRAHADYTLGCQPVTPRRVSRAAPYVLRRDGDMLTVHFLYHTDYRKAVIERKVQAKRQGRRLGNLMHHLQDELSDDELRRRLEWVAQLAALWKHQADPGAASTPGPGSSPSGSVSLEMTLSNR